VCEGVCRFSQTVCNRTCGRKCVKVKKEGVFPDVGGRGKSRGGIPWWGSRNVNVSQTIFTIFFKMNS